MARSVRNPGASVRARLLNLARERNQPFDLLLTRYVLERFLHRLSQTPYRDQFVLKGAMLIATWFADPHRPTRDVDLLGFGDPDAGGVLATFREICAVPAEDGVAFDLDSLVVDRIREDAVYGGLRLKATAIVDGARVRVVVDIGFGDAVEPGLEELVLPVLLDLPAPRLRAYARETVVAEKFQAMVVLGRANTRLKDFYDIWVLARSYDFADDRLARAIAATFRRRDTAIPLEPPEALTTAFAEDPLKQRQWRAFLADVAVDPGDLRAVIQDLAEFLMPHSRQARALTSGTAG